MREHRTGRSYSTLMSALLSRGGGLYRFRSRFLRGVRRLNGFFNRLIHRNLFNGAFLSCLFFSRRVQRLQTLSTLSLGTSQRLLINDGKMPPRSCTGSSCGSFS